MQYKTNAVNTELTEDLLKSLSKEERETILDYISSIVFLQNLTNPNRLYAKDLQRWDYPNLDEVDVTKPIHRKLDPNGRVRVDITNPHILENIDFFREAALHFEQHGVYTFIKPDRNPYGAYRKFWDEQIERCWNGMMRPSDGEWITGYHYFYLNFSPVLKTVTRADGTDERITGLPDFYDGDYWFFHYIDRSRRNKKHSGGLKKRGAGYSLKGASMLGRNFIVGESKMVNKEVNSIAIANEKEYLTKDGILNKFVNVIDFNANHTPFPNRRELKDSWQSMHWQMGWKDNDTGLIKGTQNQVMGVTLKNDPEKARGKRAIFILWEEFGKFDQSIKAWNIGRPSTEDGKKVFGQMVFWGTGGTASEAFKGLREIFYSPGGYNVYELPNVWDKNTKVGNTCAFFHSGYLNQVGFMDKDGNSDVVASLLSVIKDRIQIKYHSNDSSTLPQMIAEMALTPQEAIMKVSGTLFPTVDIQDYLEECRINFNKFTEAHLIGDLIVKADGTIDFKENYNKRAITTYNKDKTNTEGAVSIYSLPQIDNFTKLPYQHRYIIGIDPIDNDYTETGSLGCAVVYDLWNEEIVADYIGRPQLADDFYEICRRMIVFYNGVANYENNIKGLFGYFNNKTCLHLLCDTPAYLRDVEEQKQNLFGNRAKGTRASQGVIADGLRLQKTSMLSPAESYNPQDPENPIQTIRLRKIPSLRYLEELYEFNTDGNFDYISAMNMVMILRQDKLKLTESLSTEGNLQYIEEDKFIRDNYDLIYDNKKYLELLEDETKILKQNNKQITQYEI